ncbi:hypothetical protein D3C80_2143230 [compost metagenome]
MGHGVRVQFQLVTNDLGGIFRQWMLAEQGSGDVGQAQPGAVGQVLPGQILACLGVED